MMDPELVERITARRAELDELEERLAKQLAEGKCAMVHAIPGTAAAGACVAHSRIVIR
ncbi:hypothetical protein [Streptomyces sp. NBC_00467]|uniref:hypothetical protein n=1 Tax=Streptomyces sp. NBC_00467 TaxID=2975752 RepID=UPI002E193B30